MRVLKSLLLLILSIAAGAALMLLIRGARWEDLSPWLIANLAMLAVVAVPAMFASVYLAVLIHELGHVVAGLIVGFRFHTMYVGPVLCTSRAGKLRVRWAGRMRVGGLAHMIPPPGPPDVMAFRAYICGGPIASLLWAGLSLLWAIAILATAESMEAPARAIVSVLGVVLPVAAVLILPGSLLPRIFAGNPTDAYLLLAMRRPGPELDRLLALFELGREALFGVRARDWNEDLIGVAAGLLDGSEFERRAQYIRYWRAADAAEWEIAEEALQRLEVVVPVAKKGIGVTDMAIHHELAFFKAWQRGLVDEARRHLAKVEDAPWFLEASRHRAEAAIAWARGDFHAAVRSLDRATEALDRFVRTAQISATAELDLLNHLRKCFQAPAEPHLESDGSQSSN